MKRCRHNMTKPFCSEYICWWISLFQFFHSILSTWIVQDQENSESIFISFLHLAVSHTDNRGSQVFTQEYKIANFFILWHPEGQIKGWTVKKETIIYVKCSPYTTLNSYTKTQLQFPSKVWKFWTSPTMFITFGLQYPTTKRNYFRTTESYHPPFKVDSSSWFFRCPEQL